MSTRTPEATVHILSSTVAEVHVGSEVEEVIAADSRALRDRVVEEIRLLAASAGEPARATLVEGSSRWPLIVNPDGTFAESLEPAPAVAEPAPAATAAPAYSPAPAYTPAPAVAETAAVPATAAQPATPATPAEPVLTRSSASSARDVAKPTVQDLLDSREGGDRPRATEGWQGAVRRATGGLIAPQPGRAEQSRLDREKRVQRRLDAPRTIVVLNPKGGAHKTTSTLLLAATFGTLRGGATLAWDNNETRGTLGWRAQNAPHHRTAVDLLADL
ncbi:MAG: ParA family protein, partial [Microbacterium sp.]